MKKWLSSHRYVLWVLYVPVYVILFIIMEHAVTDNYWVSYMPIDDAIPFIPQFILGYCLWYPFLFGPGLYLLFFDSETFTRYMWSLAIGFTTTILFCLLFPNGQDLRPALPENGDLFIRMVQGIYRSDTNTNVLPSMHVIGACAVVFAVWDSPVLRRPWVRAGSVIAATLICVSTLFVKQHSLLDVLTGLLSSAILYVIVYVILKNLQKKRAAKKAAGASGGGSQERSA